MHLPVDVHAKVVTGCFLSPSPASVFEASFSMNSELPESTCVCPTVLWLEMCSVSGYHVSAREQNLTH